MDSFLECFMANQPKGKNNISSNIFIVNKKNLIQLYEDN